MTADFLERLAGRLQLIADGIVGSAHRDLNDEVRLIRARVRKSDETYEVCETEPGPGSITQVSVGLLRTESRYGKPRKQALPPDYKKRREVGGK